MPPKFWRIAELSEVEGFEPPRRLTDLSVFETDPVTAWVHLYMAVCAGFEPAKVLPLPAFQAGALDQTMRTHRMADGLGLEPRSRFRDDGLASRCLTIRLPIHRKQYQRFALLAEISSKRKRPRVMVSRERCLLFSVLLYIPNYLVRQNVITVSIERLSCKFAIALPILELLLHDKIVCCSWHIRREDSLCCNRATVANIALNSFQNFLTV